MKIDANLAAQAESLLGANAATRPSGRAAGSSGGGQSDSVVLSTSADRVTLLAAQALAAPEVRQQRVAALAAAVQNGSYRVSDQQIAGSIVEQLRRF